MLTDLRTGRMWLTWAEAEHVQAAIAERGRYVGTAEIRAHPLRALETASPVSDLARAMREDMEEAHGVIAPEPWRTPEDTVEI